MMVVDRNMYEQVKMIFNVDFKTFSSTIKECICWCMSFIEIKMHGTPIKIKNYFLTYLLSYLLHVAESFLRI